MPIATVPRQHDRGFTLIEVMMAVLLVGVLVGIALPVYKGYQDKIRNNQAEMDVVAMSAAVHNYWVDMRQYPASLADVGLSGKLDPWGRPYVYYNIEANGKGGARQDHALNPLNTDFDLYSCGADGQSKPQITQKSSLDDIIRASNGSYVGLASDF